MNPVKWEEIFSQMKMDDCPDSPIASIPSVKSFLDKQQIPLCLIKPYWDLFPNYPIVDTRELLPSFESDLIEYKDLPGFSMVALARPLGYFQEIFQFDILHDIVLNGIRKKSEQEAKIQKIRRRNLETLLARSPRQYHNTIKAEFNGLDLTTLDSYGKLLPILLEMDRAHLMAFNSSKESPEFGLRGVYASLPSDLDSEIKRFGLRIGKFSLQDDEAYEKNRSFVYQYLMELHGFPIVSERRTSAALFAGKLHRLGEKFLVRVLGQSDRAITTLYSDSQAKQYPKVEKIALISVADKPKELLKTLEDGGFFVDPQNKIVLLKVGYRQHKYDPNNVRQDRALSVYSQEIIHPLTGESLDKLNIVKDSNSLFLRFNDIVQGEYHGRTIYKRSELIESTETDEKRLKVLYSWLSKHQRRIISYSDDFYANIIKIMDGYLLNPKNFEAFENLRSLHQEVWEKYSYIQQARRIKDLEDIQERLYKGRKLNLLEMLQACSEVINDLKFETAVYFDDLVEQVLSIGEKIINERQIQKYIHKNESDATAYAKSIKKAYGRVVSLLDELRHIRASRKEPPRLAPVTD